MPLIIETDLGHDPDDLFTILWLLAAGVDISAIVVTPGDPDQLAVAQFIRDETLSSFLIGAADLTRTKQSSGSVHHALLQRYGRPLDAGADDLGDEVIRVVHTRDTEMLIIGPPSNLREWFGLCKGCWPRRATMQGGFVPYSLYRPTVVLDSFLDKDWMPSFNPNGDRRGMDAFLAAPFPRRMVGKNVCHTVVFDPASQVPRFAAPPNRAAELFLEAATLLKREKRFHDPVAAVCHLHPEVGLWIDGKTARRDQGWTTVPGEDKILVDLDRDAFWEHICSWA